MPPIYKNQLSLILLAIGITLMPLSVTTGFLAYRALTESSRYLDAPLLDKAKQHAKIKQFSIYKVSGSLKGDLLNPPEYPEVKDALWYRVVSERRPSPSAPWHRDTTTTLVAQRVQQFTIDGEAVEVGLLSKVALPIIQVHRDLGPFHRLSVEYKSVTALKGPLTAIGYQKQGKLGDGIFERLLVLDPEDQESVLTQITRKGYHKGIFLGGISGIFLGLMIAMIPFSRRLAAPS